VAVDQHIHRRLKDDEGQLFAKVLRQAGQGLDGRSQGVFCFTPDGTLLTFANVVDAEPALRLLNGALAKFDPSTAAAAEAAAVGRFPLPQPPVGGLIVDVTSRVLGGYDASDKRAQVYLESLGRDHLWIRKDEVEALAKSLAAGTIPTSLAQRLARYHLVDNTRGEPPMWEASEIKRLELTIEGGQVRGVVHLETRRGDRGYQADIAGVIEVQEGRISRLDLVAKGQFWGEGTFTPNAPKGNFPLAVACRLAAADCAASQVPPQAARLGADEYLR
jgi:hypothetical protein